MDEGFKKKLLRLITNRMLILTIVIAALFYWLIAMLFELQIVEGKYYNDELQATWLETTDIPAPRGAIYDRFGRPLAVNVSAYTVKLNPGIQVENMNECLLAAANLFEKNNEKVDTGFPISRSRPYTYDFGGSEAREKRWKEDMALDEDAAPDEAVAKLRERFALPEDMSDDDAWKTLSLRALIYMHRYKQHEQVTVAFDVSLDTVVNIEEHSELYRPFYVDVQPLRKYPGGIYVSHILGYVGKITDKEYEDNKSKGYKPTDLIGKTGLEKAFEENFKGTNGSETVEMAQNWRPVQTISAVMPVQGDKLYTTLDLEFQKTVYHLLEDELTETLKNKLLGASDNEDPITLKEFFASIVKHNTVSVKDIMQSAQGSDGYALREYVYRIRPEFSMATENALTEAKDVIIKGIEYGDISNQQILLVMLEQGVIKGDENFDTMLRTGSFTSLQVVLNLLDEGQITPQMTGLDPCTGSVCVVNAQTGDVLAAVSYPSYDNNQFVNVFNNDYYYKLYDDPTRPMINRAFMEPRAPGSTFKMISAVAGLESGAINQYTQIYDELEFTKAGKPYPKCWSSVSHSSINVMQALEHSCNYFFSEMAYRMGNSKEGTGMDSIATLDKYMIEFGLNERSGVEIGEYRDTLTETVNGAEQPIPLAISSPAFKEYIVKSRNPEATRLDLDWYDGNTTHTSFGQSYNNYTAAAMVKYVATLASRGVRRDLHLMNWIESQNGELKKRYKPEKETVIDVRPENLNIVYDGMLRVTKTGTAAAVFKDFPIQVAGKTGTAQESNSRPDHTSFAGFAPFQNPEIAVYVLIPYGDSKANPASSSQVGRDVMRAYFGLDTEPLTGGAIHTLTP